MSKKLFSFNGRIRRTEFGITLIIYFFVLLILQNFVEEVEGPLSLLFFVFYILLAWVFYAQGAKRAHDIGDSGWYQLIPLYFLWLLFADSDKGINEYGPNPKEIEGENGSIE